MKKILLFCLQYKWRKCSSRQQNECLPLILHITSGKPETLILTANLGCLINDHARLLISESFFTLPTVYHRHSITISPLKFENLTTALFIEYFWKTEWMFSVYFMAENRIYYNKNTFEKLHITSGKSRNFIENI